MKVYNISVRFDVRMEVPDDFPIEPARIGRFIDWQSNDYEDGRYPFCTELANQGVQHMVQNGVHRAISDHVWHQPKFNTNKHIRERDRKEAAIQKSVSIRLDHETDAVVRDSTSSLQQYVGGWVVLCKVTFGEREGQYDLATRRVFDSYEAAQQYAQTCHKNYEPMIVNGRWDQLRLP